jgi:hypothetical protein
MSHPDPKMTSPKTSGPEMGVAVSEEVCGEQEFLPPLFSSFTLSF